jgi:predicted dehydrogenase
VTSTEGAAGARLRIGISGAPRGKAFLTGLAAYRDAAELVAVYDPDPAAAAALPSPTRLEAPRSYEDMLGLVDVVIVASPQQHHAPQAIAALERGVHVLSEVPAAVSLEQAHRLVAATRRSQALYMMAENYCYTRANLTLAAMARAGAFGEIYFGEGEYLHEMKGYHTDSDGRPTWRYHWQVGRAGITYPTHSLGPLLRWLDDRVVAVSCVGSGRHTDPEHEIDDTVLLLARTSRGTLLKLRLDLLSNRPHLMNYYSVQGTLGCYEASRIASDSLGYVHISGQSKPNAWEPLEDYVGDYLPEAYRGAAQGAGHWGADLWPVREFLDAVSNGSEPPLDVYSALDMTLPGLVSEDSFYQGGQWLAVPNPRLWSAGIGVDPGREAPLA